MNKRKSKRGDPEFDPILDTPLDVVLDAKSGYTPKPRPSEVIVTNVKIPFWSLMVLMIEIVLASVPAIIIAAVILFAIGAVFTGGLATLGGLLN